MIQSKRVPYIERKISDAALDGRSGGSAAGMAMAAYLVIWGWQPGVKFWRGAVRSGMRGAAAGGLTHRRVASVYGILFGLIWWMLQRGLRVAVPAWLVGAVYGLALLGVAKAVVLPVASSPLDEIPTLHFAVAHAILRAALGWLSEWLAGRNA